MLACCKWIYLLTGDHIWLPVAFDVENTCRYIYFCISDGFKRASVVWVGLVSIWDSFPSYFHLEDATACLVGITMVIGFDSSLVFAISTRLHLVYDQMMIKTGLLHPLCACVYMTVQIMNKTIWFVHDDVYTSLQLLGFADVEDFFYTVGLCLSCSSSLAVQVTSPFACSSVLVLCGRRTGTLLFLVFLVF